MTAKFKTASEYKAELVGKDTDVLKRHLKKFEEIKSESLANGDDTQAIDAKIVAIQSTLYERGE